MFRAAARPCAPGPGSAPGARAATLRELRRQDGPRPQQHDEGLRCSDAGALIACSIGAAAFRRRHAGQRGRSPLRSRRGAIKRRAAAQEASVPTDQEVQEPAAETASSSSALSSLKGFDSSRWLTGKISKVTAVGVHVAVSAPDDDSPLEGLVHKSQIEDGVDYFVDFEFQPGTEVKVRVIGVDEAKERLELSMKEEGADEDGESKVSAFQNFDSSEWLKGEVVRAKPFGVFVRVKAADDETSCIGLVHVAQIEQAGTAKKIEDRFKEREEAKVRIIGIDTAKDRLHLSMKEEGEDEEIEEAELSLFEGFDPSAWLKGTVVGAKDFGVFVRVPAPDGTASYIGLVHIKNVKVDAEGKTMQERFPVGEQVVVRITAVDVAEKKMMLSMLAEGEESSLGGEHLAAFKDVESSTWLTGRVVGVKPFGIFVEVATADNKARCKGLVHVSQVMETLGKLEDEFIIGQDVEVRVVDVDVEGGKLTLSMKGQQAQVRAFKKIATSKWMTATVASAKRFGVFARVRTPDGDSECIGMVHASQVKDEHMGKLEESFERGQTIQVRVTKVDEEVQRLSLSMRAGGEKLRAQVSDFEGIGPERWLHATVKESGSKRVTVDVDLPDSEAACVGIAMAHEIPQAITSFEEEYKPGQDVKVRIVSLNQKEGTLNLTMKAPLSSFEGADSSAWRMSTIVSATSFGVFVKVPGPDGNGMAKGMVHMSQIPNGRKIDLQEKYKKGQRIQVRVEGIDDEKEFLKLTMMGGDEGAAAAELRQLRASGGKGRGKGQGKGAGEAQSQPGPSAEAEGAEDRAAEDEAAAAEQDAAQAEAMETQAAEAEAMEAQVSDGDGAIAPSSAFRDVDPCKWLPATVLSIGQKGLDVSVSAPDGSGVAKSMVPMSRISERGSEKIRLEDEFLVGQEVYVRCIGVASTGMIQLSMTTADAQKSAKAEKSAKAKPATQKEPKQEQDTLKEFSRLPPSQWLMGKVQSARTTGLLVDVKTPTGSATATGMLLFSEMTGVTDDKLWDIETVYPPGRMVKVRVNEVDSMRESLFLSMKEDSPSVSAFEGMDSSEWITGTIDSVAEFGLFVNVPPPDGEGSVKGLVHFSRLPKEGSLRDGTFKPGQEVKIRIEELDVDSDRMKLSMLPEGAVYTKGESSDYTAFQDLDENQWLSGVVTGAKSFGVFVRVTSADGKATMEGLCRKIEIPRVDPELDVQDEYLKGTKVRVRVLGVDVDKGEASLSMKAPLSVFEDLGPSHWMTATVTEVRPFGVHAYVEAPDDGGKMSGFVHVASVPTDLQRLESSLKVGQQIQVRCLKISERMDLLLSMMPEDEERIPVELQAPVSAFESLLDAPERLPAKVMANTPMGLFVAVPAPDGKSFAMAKVPFSQMPIETVATVQSIQVGQEVKVRVIRLDSDSNKMDLSMKSVEQEDNDARADVSVFKDADTSGWLTGKVVASKANGVALLVPGPDGKSTFKGFMRRTDVEVQENYNTMFETGKEVYVRILHLDRARNDILFTNKAEFAAFEDVDPETWLTGTVESVTDFGIFVLLPGPGGKGILKGLVHASAIPKPDYDRLQNRDFTIGEEVKVRLIELDAFTEKVTLSMLQVGEASPTASSSSGRREPDFGSVKEFEGVSPSQWHISTVDSVAKFGVFVKMTAPGSQVLVKGLVHESNVADDPSAASNLSLEWRFQPGQELRVRVLSIDVEKNQMELSTRAEGVDDDFFEC